LHAVPVFLQWPLAKLVSAVWAEGIGHCSVFLSYLYVYAIIIVELMNKNIEIKHQHDFIK
jgi:hypothetical protein